MLYADDADTVSRSREQPCEDDDGRYRYGVQFVGIDSFGSQDGDHVPGDETYGQGPFRYRGSLLGVQTNRQACVPFGNCGGERRPYC